MRRLNTIRLVNLCEGKCGVCGDFGLHMHADTDLCKGMSSDEAAWIEEYLTRKPVIRAAVLVCEDCASHLRTAEIQLREWLGAAEESVAHLVFVNVCHYSRYQAHWNGVRCLNGGEGGQA